MSDDGWFGWPEVVDSSEFHGPQVVKQAAARLAKQRDDSVVELPDPDIKRMVTEAIVDWDLGSAEMVDHWDEVQTPAAAPENTSWDATPTDPGFLQDFVPAMELTPPPELRELPDPPRPSVVRFDPDDNGAEAETEIPVKAAFHMQAAHSASARIQRRMRGHSGAPRF